MGNGNVLYAKKCLIIPENYKAVETHPKYYLSDKDGKSDAYLEPFQPPFSQKSSS